MKRIFLMLFVFAGFISCNQKISEGDSKDSKTDNTESSNKFGEAITDKGAISFEELVSKMETADSMQVKVRGTVEEVCQAKGCWMNIVSTKTDKEMFVKFKDYGFFMPKDISGQEVIMEGYAFREFTPVDELRHYAEDAGKSEEEIAAITEPEEEFKFMASGVILVKKEKGMK